MRDAAIAEVGDVPRGPFFHGSRLIYEPGALLQTDVVNNIEGEEDDRLMCFATTSADRALVWAYQRGIVHGGASLYVYEVEMTDPEIDVNMHQPGRAGLVESVMSARGRVVHLAQTVTVADFERRERLRRGS